LNQGFGDTANLAYYALNGINFKGHNGQDCQARYGQPVYAMCDGVCFPEVDSKQGQGVNIVTREQFDYNGKPVFYKVLVWHLTDDDAVVKTGQVVRAGDLIGYADNTGLSTGTHCHVGVKPCAYNSIGTLYNLEDGNGFYGAVDPAPYWNGLFAEDLNVNLVKKNIITHTFYIPMKRGDVNSEVLYLQRALQSIGYFPENVIPNSIFGPVTQAALFAFQKKYVTNTMSSFVEVWYYMGQYCGAKSLKALNAIFAPPTVLPK